MSEQLILPLSSRAQLELVGGKAQSLSRLSNAGFRVPKTAILTTDAYKRIVEANSIHTRLQEAALPEISSGNLVFTGAAARVRELLERVVLTDDLLDTLTSVYDELGQNDRPLAVRSSATVEDQPSHSFAGQHATYLNVSGMEALIEAVRNCWISLWSERALSYRYQVGIKNTDVAMAIVIQELVSADVAGVMFTANPVTGVRDEIHISASFGLGERVVSGTVDPDDFVLDRSTFNIKSIRLGSGLVQDNENSDRRGTSQSTTDELIDKACLARSELSTLGHQGIAIENLFSALPQDIEWAFSDGELWLLQSRAITNLPPEPLENVQWEPPEPGAYLQRSQWVEHVPDPVCTLFEDLHMRRSLQEAWGRNLTRRGNHEFEDTQPPASFCLTTTVNGFAYRHVGEPPRSGHAVGVGNRKQRGSRIGRYLSMWRMYLVFVPTWRFFTLPRYLKQIQTWQKLNTREASIEQLWKGIRFLSQADAAYWFNKGVWNAFALSRGTEVQLHNFLRNEESSDFTSGQFLSGLKSPAFDSQVALHQLAILIRKNEQLYHDIVTSPPEETLEILASISEGRQAHDAFEAFMDKFGHQLSTLDFSVPFEAENPVSTIQSLHAYLRNPDLNPIENRRRLLLQQKQARRNAFNYFRGLSRIKYIWRVWIARRYYPYREAAMFHLGRAWTVLRPFALELGERLTAAGTLSTPDDIFYLNTDELGRAIRSVISVSRLPTAHREKHYPNGAGLPALAQQALERRILQDRRKNLRPPFLIPGPPPWASLESPDVIQSSSKVLRGSPVSPGRVTGKACVIKSVEDFSALQSGSILVCPTTTPAWTPLFPQIVGLVTDIGGILAHGSIVAREFGIPAVLGLENATETIHDGQLITVDGDTGTVEL